MEREQYRPRWREGPSRGYDYHDRQVARERNEFPAAKRGRREGSPAYPSYREASPAPGPMFPTAPRDRYETYPPPGVARGRGLAGRGYGRMPEPRRAHYPAVPPGMRPPPPARTGWPPHEARDFRDAPGRQGQFYPQHETSPTPSPRAWQGDPHGMDHAHPAGPLGVPHPTLRYGSPAHFDPMAPGPRDTAHLSNPMRFQEEAERRPSPRDVGRPLSRGQSLERGWQPPPMRGSGPGPSPASYGPAPQGGPRPILTSGPARRDTGYSRYVHSESLPAPPMGRGKDSRARSGSAPGRGPYSRAAQERSASGPRDRGFPHGRVSSSLPNIHEPLPAPPTGSGPGAPPNRTPERSQRSSGARNGSKEGSTARDRRRDVSHGSRDTAQRGHSSSSRPSRAASGATGHSPMRSSGASREFARKQSGRIESPPKSRLSAPQLPATASLMQAEPSTALPEPPAAPRPHLPTTTAADDQPPPTKTAVHASSGSAAISSSPSMPPITADQPVDALPRRPSGLQPQSSSPQILSTLLPEAATAEPAVAARVNTSSAMLPEVSAASGTLEATPSTEGPPPKRPKLQFGKGLASRMSSAAQSELLLPDSANGVTESTIPDPASHVAQAQPSGDEARGQTPAFQGPQYPAGTPERARAEQLKIESESPATVVATLENLLAQNSPESLSRLSWSQLHKDLQAWNTHKTRLQESIREYSEQEQTLTQEVELAQAEQEAALRQQQEQQQQRAKALEKEAQITAQLAAVQADIAQLQEAAQQTLVLSDVSRSEEKDPEISSSDESDSASEPESASPQAVQQQNGQRSAQAAYPRGHLPGSDTRVMSMTDTLQRLQASNTAPAVLSDNLIYLLHHEQQIDTIIQVNSKNQAIAKQQHWESVGKHLPEGFVAAAEPLDIPNMPLVKQIQADYAAAKPAMLRHMAQRKRLVLAKQMEIASRYNAEFERLYQHDAGRTRAEAVEYTPEERSRILIAQERIRNQVKIPEQILDPVEKQHSIFVDRNNQYDLKEAREAEQASLQLNEADQVKFGKAFIRFPKKWGKIAEIMGDRTAFQCAMIYNDQKDSDWFRPTLSQYGRTKRRATATNKQQRFLSSATAVPPRPQSADKPPKGRVTTVVATAVANQGAPPLDAPPRPGRSKGRGAAAKGPPKAPALRGRPSRTGGMAVAAAVLTTTEGEEVGTVDTAAVATSEAGGTPTVARTRYEFDLPWTPEEEQKLAEASSLNPGNVRAIALHVGSRTQKAVRAHLKKMDASRAAAGLGQQQMHADEAVLQAGQAGAFPEQGDVAILQAPAETDEGLGALEAVERLEGSPAPEDRPDQPLLPGREYHWDNQGYAEAAAAPDAQQQADNVRFTESLLPDWAAATSGPYLGAVPQALPPGSLPGPFRPAMGPMFMPGQPPFLPSQLVSINPAILQLILSQLGQPQPSQGLHQPQGQQQPQQLPMHNMFYQHLMQMQAATSMASGGYPQQNLGTMPSLMHGPLGLAAGVQQPLPPGHFGRLQPPGQSQTPLHPMAGPPGGFAPAVPGLSQHDQPLILQPPIAPELPGARQGEAGHSMDWAPGPLAVQDEAASDRPASPMSGLAEHSAADDRDSQADPQDSANQGQQEAAPALRADSAPGSASGPEGPPSVSKGARPGGSKSGSKPSPSGPKRQMNFWQEDEKTAFINAYKMYGVDWDTLAKEIPTKEKTQIKNYYQNYKLRLELDQIDLPQNAKHPKASRGKGQGGGDSSRASTPRPGSARGSSRQGSESGDPIQAIVDEAVEAATEAVAAAGHSDATGMEPHQTAAGSDGVLPTRISNDSQSRGSSPEAALAVPVEGGSPSHTRLTPPPSRLTPPPPALGLGAADLGWGLADRLRQAWVGGALVPHTTLQTDFAGINPQGFHPPQQGTPPPRPRTAGAFHPSSSQLTPSAPQQATPEAMCSSKATTQEEASLLNSKLVTAALARIGHAQPTATPLGPHSDSAPEPTSTAIAVTVAVKDQPVAATSAGMAKTGNIAERQMPTLLPNPSSSQGAAVHTASPLVPALLEALSPAKGQKQLPRTDQPEALSHSQVEAQSHPEAEPYSEHATSRDHPAGQSNPVLDHPAGQSNPGLDHPVASVEEGAGPAGQAEQPFSLASATAERFQHLPGTEAERYSLPSAISKQFGSLSDPGSSSLNQHPGDAAVPRLNSATQVQHEFVDSGLADQLIGNRFQKLDGDTAATEPASSSRDATTAASHSQDQLAASEAHVMPTLSEHSFAVSDAVNSSTAHRTHENVPSQMQPPNENAADAAQTNSQQH